MARKLYKITISRPSDNQNHKLSLYYTSSRKLQKVAFDLRRAGFTVDGLYDPALAVDQDSSDALETAHVFLHN